jgi:5-(carboxyamino)imidazole ribonucleotide mutase
MLPRFFVCCFRYGLGMKQALVGIVMGSQSDGPTMAHCRDILVELGIEHDYQVLSAHRMPDEMFAYAAGARSRGLQVIIAGAGGAAHLPGMIASKTTLPVLGVPIMSRSLSGVDSLLSIVQMPAGVPVGTLAIGDAGAKNAAPQQPDLNGQARAPTRGPT